jgi:exopolysaccharide biosynthesis polyprenyl glycosylphosphotransferase
MRVAGPRPGFPILIPDVLTRLRTSGPAPAPADDGSPGIFEAPGAPAGRARDRRYRRSLVLADALAAALAVLIGVTVVGDDSLRPAAALFVPLAVVVSKAVGLYDRDELLLHKTTLDDVPALLQLTTAYTLLAWLASPLVIDGSLSRTQALGLWILLLVAGVCARAAARQFARATAPAERCLLVGDVEAEQRLSRQFRDGAGVWAEIAGRVELAPGEQPERTLKRIRHALLRTDVHRVIFAPRTLETDAVLDVIQLSKALGAKVSLLPRVFEVVGSSVEFDDLGGMPVLGVRQFGLSRSSRVLKRTLDLLGAGVVLLVTAPLMLVLALAIKLGSRGPVLFRQTRVGRDGRRFEMLKFRTMVDGADALKAQLRERNEADGLFKIADDPRVTGVGRFLRHTSLDELPQLLNVLRGEMSLVGPRPLVVEEDAMVQGWHRRRLHLEPGMTGQWQILGSARIPLSEMVKIDYLYVANWSLWGDLKILLRTVPYLLRARGM